MWNRVSRVQARCIHSAWNVCRAISCYSRSRVWCTVHRKNTKTLSLKPANLAIHPVKTASMLQPASHASLENSGKTSLVSTTAGNRACTRTTSRTSVCRVDTLVSHVKTVLYNACSAKTAITLMTLTNRVCPVLHSADSAMGRTPSTTAQTATRASSRKSDGSSVRRPVLHTNTETSSSDCARPATLLARSVIMLEISAAFLVTLDRTLRTGRAWTKTPVGTTSMPIPPPTSVSLATSCVRLKFIIYF